MTNIVCDAAKTVARSEHAIAREPTSSIIYCALHHRIGIVPVGEPSIGMNTLARAILALTLYPFQVIAVSSPHRKEAFLVCELILEEVKKKAQIWKREFYEGEGDSMAEWKANQTS